MAIGDNKLPIRRLTLYKHGVGFVEREGKVIGGQEVQLVFRQTEVNDALKSLLVLDRQGGQVRGIHYETPSDNFPPENQITLRPDHSLLDLLRSLRGRLVRLLVGEGTTAQEYGGQLVGVEVDPNEPLTRSLVTLLLADEKTPAATQIVALPVSQLKALFLLEERAGQDLRFVLDSSRTDEAHRTITLQLNASPNETETTAHDLAVSYLMPCPTWRVSYRLIAETATTAAEADTDRQGELLLQGWGLFDNRLEEDLEDVKVRLVAGQPISFIYDLTSSRIPQRPLVQDEARVASGPVEFEAALPPAEVGMMGYAAASSVAPSPNQSTQTGLRLAKMNMSAAPAVMGGVPLRQAMQNQTVSATVSNLGELFQYEVTAPVTVKRGESALVPILHHSLPYRHELLYNGQKMARHPVAALRFKNSTGLVLERGPITVVEDEEYRGEALIPFTPADGEVYLAYAVELGLKVSEEQTSYTDTTGLQIKDANLYFNQITTLRTSYQLENNLAQPRVVTIEQLVRPGYELSPGTPPTREKTAEFYRWTVSCLPRQLTTWVVEERMLNWRNEQVLNQDYSQLNEYLKKKWLDAGTLARLKQVLDEQARIIHNSQEVSDMETERENLYRRQEQLRQNLTVLATTGDEAQLRRRVFEQLSQSEERLNLIDQRIGQLKNDNQSRQQNLNRLLINLV